MKRVHSFLTPKAGIKNSLIRGRGVFAKKLIKKGELIAAWGGYIITSKEIQRLPKEILDYDYPVQVFEGLYLGPKKTGDLDDAEMFNHSCSPNAGVKGQNILIAKRDIKPGEEICFDYETTDSEGLNIVCECGAKNCRGKITGSSWRDPKFRKENKGYFSWYLQEKINSLKRKRR